MIYILAIGIFPSIIGCNVVDEKNNFTLNGEWHVKLDPKDQGEKENWFNTMQKDAAFINLPSTLDEALLGDEVKSEVKLDKETLYELTRKHSYIGAAWYQKEIVITADIANKEMVLEMERVLWKSQVWVDGKYKGMDNSLVTAHTINLGKLSAGKHLLTICVDNRQQYDIFDDSKDRSLAHSYTETTQIKWNGILGRFCLKVLSDFSIEDFQVYPDVDDKTISILANGKGKKGDNLIVQVVDQDGAEIVRKKIVSGEKITCNLNGDFSLWNEHHPVLYTVSIKDTKGLILAETDFGMRKIKSVNNNILLNGKRLFLRGTLECCIFPLTGHPPMDEVGWEKVFSAAKSYGLNHLRFHSWCPPEAAFSVADRMGFYLQVEMPNWSLKYGKDQEMVEWMENEGRRMIRNYGNHPSFCMMALGNELEGDYDLLAEFVKELKGLDCRHLYTITAFTFQKPHTLKPDKVDDYWITQWTKDGWVRGQGVFDDYLPSFDKDYRSSIEFLDIPLITHEIGQYSVYPNMKEIEKYTGVLAPLNFEAIKTDLQKKKRLNKADEYLLASGNLAKILYKEEIERALKTPGISGFQLLDLHDFPGQGTALVGMLDAFWDSKGIISGEEFKAFCSEFVPLLKFEKAVYTNAEVFKAKAEVANYWKDIDSALFKWRIAAGGQCLKVGEIKIDKIREGSCEELGTFEFDLRNIMMPTKLDISLTLDGTKYNNSWSIWVYPSKQKTAFKDVLVTSNWNDLEKALMVGKKVLFTPNINELKGIEGKFVPVFWSPIHFVNQPGTMGLLIDTNNSALKDFPTEFHTNWQWWDLCKKSKSLEMEGIGVERIVSVIDNFFKNRDLANLFEVKIGKGSLVFSGMDLHTDIENRTVAKALLTSLVNYMNSAEFAPKQELSFEELRKQFKLDSDSKVEKKLGLYD